MFALASVVKRQKKNGKLPELTNKIPDLNQYDYLVIAGPNWGASVSTPVISFLNKIQDYTGKVISVDSSVGEFEKRYNSQFKKFAGNLNVTATENNDSDAVVSDLE